VGRRKKSTVQRAWRRADEAVKGKVEKTEGGRLGSWEMDILSEGVYYPTRNTQLATRNVK